MLQISFANLRGNEQSSFFHSPQLVSISAQYCTVIHFEQQSVAMLQHHFRRKPVISPPTALLDGRLADFTILFL
jgi:hypothetical protein